MYLREIFEPMVDFYTMRKKCKKELFFYILIPLLIGIVTFLMAMWGLFDANIDFSEFGNELISQLITVLALFISFCMAYLTILLTSNSKNVEELKETYSKIYCMREKCTLYQVNANEVTYLLLTEIIFLIIVFSEKFLFAILNNICIKMLICFDISIFFHILFVLLSVVKNMYFSFWRSI